MAINHGTRAHEWVGTHMSVQSYPVDVIRFALLLGALRRILRRWFSPDIVQSYR
jgi:hypothetical protein